MSWNEGTLRLLKCVTYTSSCDRRIGITLLTFLVANNFGALRKLANTDILQITRSLPRSCNFTLNPSHTRSRLVRTVILMSYIFSNF